MNDKIRKYGSSNGGDAVAYVNSLLTPEELNEVNIEVELMKELTAARKEKGLTQKQLGEMCGLPQSAIANMENGKHSPSIATVSKVLSVLGKRLYIG